MLISAFLHKLEMGASLYSQQDGQFVGNKQPLHALPIGSAPTSKNYNKLELQKWFPVVLNIRNVFKRLHFGVLCGKQANQPKQEKQPTFINLLMCDGKGLSQEA